MPAIAPQELLNEAACPVCYGASTALAIEIALWDRISQNIGVETFYILTELGDILNAENNDRLRTE